MFVFPSQLFLVIVNQADFDIFFFEKTDFDKSV